MLFYSSEYANSKWLDDETYQHEPIQPVSHYYTVKRAYSGATTIRMKHYIKGELKVDNTDTVVILAGANNFSKTQASSELIALDIFEMVDVKKIHISSVTYRPGLQSEGDGKYYSFK